MVILLFFAIILIFAYFFLLGIIDFCTKLIANRTHLDDSQVKKFNKKHLSQFETFKINLHLAICHHCQELINEENGKAQASIEDHLINPED